MPDNGYYRAKVAQEKLIQASGIPYTIVRPTEFMEFLGTIAARTPCLSRVPVLASYGRMNAVTLSSESMTRSGRPRTRKGGSIMKSDGSESNLAAAAAYIIAAVATAAVLRDNQDKNSYCLIREYSPVGWSLPHSNVPQSIPLPSPSPAASDGLDPAVRPPARTPL